MPRLIARGLSNGWTRNYFVWLCWNTGHPRITCLITMFLFRKSPKHHHSHHMGNKSNICASYLYHIFSLYPVKSLKSLYSKIFVDIPTSMSHENPIFHDDIPSISHDLPWKKNVKNHHISWFNLVLSPLNHHISWVYHGLSWFIMAYHGLSWFIPIKSPYPLAWLHHRPPADDLSSLGLRFRGQHR